MKLNIKRTLWVGLAFMSISAFWQVYDSIVPLVLKDVFDLRDDIAGVIMALDNVLALFMLPIFGALSDKTTTRFGKRMPFIILGTLAACVFAFLMPVAVANKSLVLFVITLGGALLSMATYRSPAVALMPDVTPKPLRSKGNAVINLMGAIGGILYLVVTSVLYSESKTAGLTHINYLPLFIIVGAVMLVALLILMFFVNEPKLAAEQLEYEAAHPEQELTVAVNDEKAIMPKAVKKSLIFMLFSIALWFIGYNGITTWFTTYAKAVWDMDIGAASTCLTIATAGAIVSYIPVGSLASKIGRKKTIKAGVLLLALCFAGGFAFTILFNSFNPLLYILFALVGVAWAAINVNSLPMVVEMCSGSNIGKFTGLYYTFSMAAQIVTPIAAGYLIENIDYKVLFLYSAVFVMLSFVTMCFVKHGDNKPEVNKDLLENFNFED